MSIQPLPSDVIAQIKSSSTITSLNAVIFELVKNALDASCSKIDITIDYSRGSCTVEDDGFGILPSEFGDSGGLGKSYHTSKLSSSTPVHGKTGTFLASLSALSLLSIVSHHHLHRSHNSLIMHKSEVVSRQMPAPPQQHISLFNHGTRVTVRNLFGGMPVRVKQRAVASEKHMNAKLWDGLRKDIVSLLLAWPKYVSLAARETDSNQKLVIRRPLSTASVDMTQVGTIDVHNLCNILSQVSYITPDEKSWWIPIRGSTSNLSVDGAISLIPTATKHIQFVAFGIEPLITQDGRNVLYEEINRWFSNSSFGNEEEMDELDQEEAERRAKDRRYKGDGYTNKELKGGRKSVDRWPMFCIKVHQKEIPDVRRISVDDILDDKKNTLGAILELLQAIVFEFLMRNNFRPKAVRAGRSKRIIDKAVLSDQRYQVQSKSPPTTAWKMASPSTKRSGTPVATSSAQKDCLSDGGKIDMLGTKVKLPSFRRSSSGFDTSFESWSKIKSGRIVSGVKEVDKASRPKTSSVDVQQNNPNLKTSLETTTQQLMTPLISKSGRLTRRPFDDVDVPPPSRTNFSQHQPSECDPTVDENEDELVIWTNPINKVQSLVNKRTGLVVPEKKSRSANDNLLGSSRRLTLGSNPNPSDQESVPWIDEILENWKNPVFAPAEASIPQVSIDGLDMETQNIIHGRHHHCSQIDIDKAFKETSSGLNGRISKEALSKAEIISQVDKKFILAKIQTRSIVNNEPNTLLVIIDQHAADERIRIESLLAEFLAPPTIPSTPTPSSINTSPLDKPLTFDIPPKEAHLFHTHSPHFSYWGILYTLPASTPNNPTTRLRIHHLPPLITTRLITNPKLLMHILRAELHTYHSNNTPHPDITPSTTWVERVTYIPRGILELLNSRACRSAIMFGDVLGIGECRELVKRLAACKFPFVCAHGRVGMVPLGEVGCLAEGKRWSLNLGACGGRRIGRELGFPGEDREDRNGVFAVEWEKWMRRREKEREKIEKEGDNL